MKKKLIKWLVGIFLLILVAIAYFAISWQKPPIDKINEARINLTKAAKMNSSFYTGMLYRNAENYYDSAMYYWQLENKKIFFTRDYSKVEWCAVQSNRLALASIEKAKSVSKNIKKILVAQIDKLKEQTELYNKIYSSIFLSEDQRKELAKGKLLLEESIIAFRKKGYPIALKKIDSAETIIQPIIQYAKKILEEYFTNYTDWKRWAERSIGNSRKHKTYCIIIDKYARKCMLYKNGGLHRNYDIELGTNWIGDKNYQGDKSTPEGFYKIISKKSGRETMYYKALLLNYPNEEDKKRFLSNKKNGHLDTNAKIGSLIEIHGHGGKGYDWTDGCIALINKDMDELFAICSENTEVTVLGSLRSLQELLTIK